MNEFGNLSNIFVPATHPLFQPEELKFFTSSGQLKFYHDPTELNLVTSSILAGTSDTVTTKIPAESSLTSDIDKYLTQLTGPLLGSSLGMLFAKGRSTASDPRMYELTKILSFMSALGLDPEYAIRGATSGFIADKLGNGITHSMGKSNLGKGLGRGIATYLGSNWGQGIYSPAKEVGNFINANALTNAIGVGLSAATGPSKEYEGRYGHITKTADSIYDNLSNTLNFTPGGLTLASMMTLNKGLSNISGSTDAMTKLDAILGSAFMPAPVKWLNMSGSRKTGLLYNLSIEGNKKVEDFMGNAFGNIGNFINLARDESGKTYGLFSRSDRNLAQNNINFANYTYNKLLEMAYLNEYLNIRGLNLSSINNLRYVQNIEGINNYKLRGKYGMKILNNATNHNIGMRLLSGAALIDNKQMILCSAVD